MYTHTTHSIQVVVRPFFLAEQSLPEDNQYVWAYQVSIENGRSSSVKLKTRYWRITDAHGRIQEVRGAGVVGEQPSISPGKIYEYTSGVPLITPSGIMEGMYHMETEEGDNLEVSVPVFSLDSPYQKISLN